MVDIIFGDRLKKVFEWMRFRIITDYDIDCDGSNPLLYIGKSIDYVCDNTRHGHQRQRMRNYKDMLIWAVMEKKIASSVIYDFLYNIGNDDLRELITDDMRKPTKLGWRDKALYKLVLYSMKKMNEDLYCNPVSIHNDLMYTGNNAIRLTHNILFDVLNKHNHTELLPLAEFFLWVLYKDTAYRDQFFWFLDDIGGDKMKQVVHDYIKPVKQWAPNAWIASKDDTADAHRKHLIPTTTLSHAEKVNVPSWQTNQLNKIAGRHNH